MKASVCIFTYNHGQFIAQTIESVLSQVTSFEFEIIIGDDASRDNTKNVIEEYQLRFPGRIQAFFNNQNRGIMANNADTILRAQGEFIALLDGDDYWINDRKLQRQVGFLEQNTKYVYCFHDGNILKTDLTLDSVTCCQNVNKQEVEFLDIISKVSIPTFSLVFRRNALSNYPPVWFPKLDAPDRPLFLLLASRGPGFFFNQCWGVYRKHSTGHWTSRNYQSQWMTHLKIYKVLNEHFGKVYGAEFRECEKQVFLILAMRFLDDGKFRRSYVFLKRYLNAEQGNATSKKYSNIFNYFLYLLKRKLIA